MLTKIKIYFLSFGETEGRVVFYSPRKRQNFYKGKIVVTDQIRSRNVPYKCRLAKAIITETGGLASHGVLLLREYNIPCCRLSKAKKILKEGDQIRITKEGYILLTVARRFKRYLRDSSPPQFQPIKRGSWTLFRPRHYCPLHVSLKVAGIKAVPKVFLDSNKEGDCRQDRYGIWRKNYPTASSLIKKMVNEPKWFKRKLSAKKRIFSQVRRYLQGFPRKIKGDLTDKDCLKELKKGHDLLTKVTPYLLPSIATDQLVIDYYNLGKKIFTEQEMNKICNIVLRASYTQKIWKIGIIFSEKRDFTIPAQPFGRFAPISIDTKPPKLPRSVIKTLRKQSKRVQDKFIKYTNLLKIIIEIEEERAYYVRFLLRAINIIVEKIAHYLVKKRRLKELEGVLKLTYQEVLELIKGTL